VVLFALAKVVVDYSGEGFIFNATIQKLYCLRKRLVISSKLIVMLNPFIPAKKPKKLFILNKVYFVAIELFT
jgi:hypothetical protein